MSKFKPCGCGWTSDKTYVECVDHAAMRKKLNEFEKQNLNHNIRLEKYLGLQHQVHAYEKQAEYILAEMDSVWLTLTDEEIAWLDARGMKKPNNQGEE